MGTNKLGTKIVGGETYPLAKIRKDLLQKDTGIPIGKGYYFLHEPLPYRWIGDVSMQVYHDGKWKTAESIDFEF